jgi:ribose-phosphate pyrophosphokinase
MPNGIQIFGGSANPKLTADICAALSMKVGEVTIKHFADGEIWAQFQDNVRGSDVYIIQPTCATDDYSVNDSLMEAMLLINAAKLASANQVTAVLPYFGYARQDRKDRPRTPLSAKVVASMLQAEDVSRLVTMDLHSAPIQGFFDIPVDHLFALPVLIDYINANLDTSNLTIVSPDAGGTTRARLLAKKLNNAPLAIIDKFREAANVSEVMNVIGEVKGRDCLMVDDMIDTAGTLVKGSAALLERGAKSVRAAATHGLFSFDVKANISALQRIEESQIQQVIVMDTIPQAQNLSKSTKLVPLSVASLFARAIHAIHTNDSVSGLFV